MNYQYISHNYQQTVQFGHCLGQQLSAGHIICLTGELGAGKTTFITGIGQGWGTSDRVTSPTYTIMNVYRHQQNAQQLYHIDAYRLGSADDAWSIGLDDIFDDENAIIFIEWADLIKSVLPPDYLWIDIQYGANEDKRRFELTSVGDAHTILLTTLKNTLHVISN